MSAVGGLGEDTKCRSCGQRPVRPDSSGPEKFLHKSGTSSCLTNYAAAALHPAESVRSLGEVPHAVQQRRLENWKCAGCCCCCCLGSGVLSLFFLSLSLCFLNSAPPAVEKAGAPLLAPPIESRASSAHGAASVTLKSEQRGGNERRLVTES